MLRDLQTRAIGNFSHAEGVATDTNLFEGAHIMGRFGSATEEYSWFLADGDAITPDLAARISGPGEQGVTQNGWLAAPADYAEMFETFDGAPIDVGYFVTLEGNKIRKATSSDDYVLGITSATPAFVANAEELKWRSKYLKDEWGRLIKQEVQYEAEITMDGMLVRPARTELRKVVNPDFDPDRIYVPRSERPEWAAVGLVGQLRVRDDGSCHPNGYCRPNDEGIATTSPSGCRVLMRTGVNQILVMLGVSSKFL
jgi:Autotransporter adhesin